MTTDDSRILASAPADSDDWDDETWGAWFRHAERVHGSPNGRARATDQIAELTASREMAISRAVELENENARLTDELAEAKASHDPRLRCLLLKAAPDRDLYIGWSNTCDMPAGAWTRAEAIEYGFPPSRLNRADETGTSSKLGDGAWNDAGFVAEQRGWLKRDRLGDYALAWLSGRKDQVLDLLEPFEGESEVRR